MQVHVHWLDLNNYMKTIYLLLSFWKTSKHVLELQDYFFYTETELRMNSIMLSCLKTEAIANFVFVITMGRIFLFLFCFAQ